MFNLKEYIQNQQTLIDQELERRLPAGNAAPSPILHQAMRYSVFSGGKRFRPIVCLAAAQAVSDKSDSALLPACAIELLHTYSLIHDDLPALDNDNERRGQPTCHKVFGEANAILAGDGLLTVAFEWMAKAAPTLPITASQLSLELAQAAGPAGMVGGQTEDMAAQGQLSSEQQMLLIHTLKTVSLIRASVRIGALAAGAAAETVNALSEYGEQLGIVYQIVDDVEDLPTSGEESSDTRLQKITAVTVYGLQASKEKARQCAAEAVAGLQSVVLREEGKQALLALVAAKVAAL